MHDAYLTGVTLRGVQRFSCSGAHHDNMPGNVIVIRPGDVHDGRSRSHGRYAYRMICVRPDVGDSCIGAGPSPLDSRMVALNAGELFHISAIPHDSWVFGDQPYVSLHFLGAQEYATHS